MSVLTVRRAAILLATGWVCASPIPVRAADVQMALQLGVGQAGVVRLPRPAKDVVVGNPAVAEVSVENPTTVVVFGRKASGTNLTVLDGAGRTLAEATVMVGTGGGNAVAVTAASGKDVKQPGGRTVTWACAGGNCVRSGDDGADPGK